MTFLLFLLVLILIILDKNKTLTFISLISAITAKILGHGFLISFIITYIVVWGIALVVILLLGLITLISKD